MDPKFEVYTAKAKSTDPGEALDRLIEIYINACGSSRGERTIAENASHYWIARWHEQDSSITEQLSFHEVMALRSEEYRRYKESIDKYDIGFCGPFELLRISGEMIDDYDDETTRIALAAGTISYIFFMLHCNDKDGEDE